MDKILGIWSPVRETEENGKVKVEVWGRTYTAGERSFVESIVSQGEELLAAPIRLTGMENGQEMKFGNTQNFVMGKGKREEVTICSSVESDVFIVNTSCKVAFDGCTEIGLTIMPQGRSVKQCFGLEGLDQKGRVLEKLYLDIPFRKEAAKFYHFYPNSGFVQDGQKKEFDYLQQAGDIHGKIELPFTEQVYISNDHAGLAVFWESDEFFQPQEKTDCIEIFETDEAVVLRYKLLDSMPWHWKERGNWSELDMRPITYRFGIMATPVKPFDHEYYREHAIHIDCFTKIAEDYETFLLHPFGDDATALDRFQRLGVNTLYLHEKWNDIQNSPFLTKRTEDRLRLIVKQAHERGIKVIPYFGYELSTLSPYYAMLGEEVCQREEEGNGSWSWYRQPAQRDVVVCLHSQWQDIFLKNVEQLLDEFGFDGVYLDSTSRPMGCANEKHGCGYRDKEGKLHKTYPVWAVRNFMRRLYEIVDARGGTINCHGATAFNIPAAPFCHSMWEGEMMQQKLMTGEADTIAEGHIRAVFTGRNIGVPVYMLCYSNPPVWTFEQALAESVMYGIMPKPVDTGIPLERMSEIWRVTEQFDQKKACWHPFYEEARSVRVSDSAVRVSYYEAEDGKKLVFAVNTSWKDIEDVEIDFGDFCSTKSLKAKGYAVFITD